jgi:hypothetical protein
VWAQVTYRVLRVDLHDLVTLHVVHGTAVLHRLALHDSLHVGAPPVLGGDEDAW